MSDLIQLNGLVPDGTKVPAQAPSHHRIAVGGMIAVARAWPKTLEGDAPDTEHLVEQALIHNSLLQAYCQHGPVLPLRFGTVFSSAQSVRRSVLSRRDRLAGTLQRLTGLAEYTVQVTQLDRPAPVAKQEAKHNAVTGRAFLASRLGARTTRTTLSTQRQGFLGEIRQLVKDCAPVAVKALPGRADHLLSLSVLLPTKKVQSLHRMVAGQNPLAAQLALHLTVTGPWPPYAFCSDADLQTEDAALA